MPDAWTIRPACAADAEGISALVADLARRCIAPGCSAEGTAHLLASMQADQVAARLRGDYLYRVATTADDSIGGVAAMRTPAHLYHLFVAEPLQRRGLARALWDAVRSDFLARHGMQPVSVNAARGAVAAYARLGFIVQGREQVHDGVPSTPMLWTPTPAA